MWWAALIQAGIGLTQSLIAGEKLKKLQNQPQSYLSESPEMIASRMRAENLAKRGFSQEETNAFMNNTAMLSNQRYKAAMTSAGGNLAGSVNAGVNYGSIKSFLDFASADASLKRSNIRYADSFSENLQRMSDENIRRKQSMRDRAEAALGGAVQAGINNIAGGAMIAAMGDKKKTDGSQGTNSTVPAQNSNYSYGYNTYQTQPDQSAWSQYMNSGQNASWASYQSGSQNQNMSPWMQNYFYNNNQSAFWNKMQRTGN